MKNLYKSAGATVLFLICSLSLLYATDFTSSSSGLWDKGATWGHSGDDVEGSGYPGSLDNATITSGKSVQIKSSGATVSNLSINKGGTLTQTNNRTLTVLGNYVVNGSHIGTNSAKVTLSGANNTIDGLGAISLGGGIYVSADRSILSSATITFASNLNIVGAVTVTNKGSVILTSPNSIVGSSSSSTWLNDVNSTLKAGNILLSNGTMIASASGNTVNYYLSGAQNVKIPSGNNYYHLSLTGAGTKTLLGNITVNGNLEIDRAILDMGSYDINIKGDFSNAGVLNTGTRTVTFSGSNAQSLSNFSGQTFYNLTLAKSSGTLTLNNDVIVTNILNLSGGTIKALPNTLTLGSGTSNVGTLTYSSGYITGKFRRWVSTAGIDILFPLGEVYNFYAPLITKFNNLTSGVLEVQMISALSTNKGLPLVDNDTSVYNAFTFGYYDINVSNGLNSTDYNLSSSGLPSFPIRSSTRLLTRADSSSNWKANGTNMRADLVNGMGRRKNLSSLPIQCVLADVTNCTTPASATTITSSTACVNSSVVYSVPNHSGSAYTWYITGGTTSGSGNSVTVNWGSNSGAGQIIVAETNSCGTSIASFRAVTLSPEAPTYISGKRFAPENTSVGNEEIYSVDSVAGYSYAWTITGGTIISGAARSTVKVRWGNAGTGHIRVAATNSCGTAVLDLPVSIYIVINSVASGLWNSASTWDCNCVPDVTNNIRVKNPHVVNFPNSDFTINHLIIDVGATLNNSTSKTLTITGDLILDGIYSGTGNVVLSSVDGIIEGSGDGINSGLISTSGTVTLSGGGKTISQTSTITRTGSINISSGISIVNNGNVTISGDIVGASSSSTWMNDENSSLRIGGIPLSTGTLYASASGNEVDYCGSGSQTIKLMNYQNLSSSGTGSRVLPSGMIKISESFSPGTNSYTSTGNTLEFDGDADQDIPVFTYNNIKFSGSGNKYPMGTLNIHGNWTNNGNFLSNGEVVNFNGTAAQVMSGSGTFDYLTIDNSSGVSISSGAGNEQRVTGVLTLINGTLTSNNNLTLASDTDQTGQIAGTGIGNISGNLSVERYAANSGWHYISAPFNGSTLPVYDDINDDVSISSRSFFYYNEPLHGSAGWTNIPSSSSTTAMEKMKGYALKYPATETTLKLTGVYNHISEASLSGISYTPSNPASSNDDGWHLIGNPYPSYIDWTLVTRPAGIKSDITFYNSDNGANATYIPAGPGNIPEEASINGATQFIPSMQAFWIQTTANNQTLTIPNSARVTDPIPTIAGLKSYWRKAASSYDALKLRVTSAGLSDETIIRFFDGAQSGIDSYDAIKNKNDAPVPSLYSICSTNNLAINSLSQNLINNSTVPLTIEVDFDGVYTFTGLALGKFDESIEIFLVDKVLNDFHNLRIDSNYSVSLTKGITADRFYVQFKSSITTGTEEALLQHNVRIVSAYQGVNLYFENVQANEFDAVVYDLLGKEIFREDRIKISSKNYFLDLPVEATGLYVVKIICNKEMYTKKINLGK